MISSDVSCFTDLFHLCCFSHRCFGETLSTLQFAKRAKMIKNKVYYIKSSYIDRRKL